MDDWKCGQCEWWWSLRGLNLLYRTIQIDYKLSYVGEYLECLSYQTVQCIDAVTLDNV